MLQTSENYNNIQEPINKQNLEDILQHKLQDRICHLHMERVICNLQYVGKNKTPRFNIRLNNYRKDVNDPKAILADKHFQKNGHRFNKHARFTITERLTKTNLDNEILRERLIQ